MAILSSEMRDAIAGAIAFGRGDAASAAAVYTQDAQVLPPNIDVLTGREAIQAFWQGAMDMGVEAVTLETVEADGAGDAVYEVGRFALKGAEGQELDAGKYVVIWKQDGGQWRVHRDIFNSSRPAPVP